MIEFRTGQTDKRTQKIYPKWEGKLFEWNLGAELRDARANRGLSQVQVAEKAGVTPKTVREVERSEGTLTSFLSVASAIDCNLVVKSGSGPGDLGRSLAKKRKALRITQKQAASLVGVSLPTIIALEKRVVV